MKAAIKPKIKNQYVAVCLGKATYLVEKSFWVSIGSDRTKFIDHIYQTKLDKVPLKNHDIYKWCETSKTYFHIDEFHLKKEKRTPRGYSIGQSKKVKNENRNKIRQRTMDINMRILRKMTSGDENTPIKCAVTGKILEGKQRFNPRTNQYHTNLRHYEMHHILTYNNMSVHKMSRRLNPGSMLQEYDLTKEKNKPFLLDVMGTIIVSQDEHKMFHDIDDFGDLEYWKANGATIPWHIRNEDNFNAFCKEYNLSVDYNIFMERHSLKWLEKNLDKIKDLDYTKPADREAFWNRFQ